MHRYRRQVSPSLVRDCTNAAGFTPAAIAAWTAFAEMGGVQVRADRDSPQSGGHRSADPPTPASETAAAIPQMRNINLETIQIVRGAEVNQNFAVRIVRENLTSSGSERSTSLRSCE